MKETPQNPVTSSLPVLYRRSEFEEVLKDYKMSAHSLEILKNTPLVLLIGASGGGRNAMMERLVQTGRYYYVVSDTTRPMRVRNGSPIEKEGLQYFFRKEDDVLEELQQGKFLEASIIHNQQVSGISVREIERAHKSGKVAITDVEVHGAATIEKVKPDVISIFVLPPSFEEWMGRIRRRSSLLDAEIKQRLETAIEEFDAALNDDKFIFVINDKMDDVLVTVDEIGRLGKHHKQAEKYAHDLAKDLRDQADAYVRKYPNW
jgi:guanylate kinase